MNKTKNSQKNSETWKKRKNLLEISKELEEKSKKFIENDKKLNEAWQDLENKNYYK
jgi:hypothetical protein